ncbi:MAG TPA: hypothetical protein VF178_05360 [Gemmatimonadaceae bacterium]
MVVRLAGIETLAEKRREAAEQASDRLHASRATIAKIGTEAGREVWYRREAGTMIIGFAKQHHGKKRQRPTV